MKYNITVRDKDGKLYTNSNGNKVTNYFGFEDSTEDENLVHLICIHTADSYKAICKEGSKIDIKVSYFSEISNSYSVLYSFYGVENKFIKH